MSVFDQPWFRSLCWALALAYMGIVFWLSHQPSIPVPPLFANQDKVFHFLEYLGLGFLFASCTVPATSLRARFWLAFVLASVYGVSDELHQSFVPGRDSSIADWLADTAGGWAGAWLFLKAESRLRRARKP